MEILVYATIDKYGLSMNGGYGAPFQQDPLPGRFSTTIPAPRWRRRAALRRDLTPPFTCCTWYLRSHGSLFDVELALLRG